MHEVAVREIGFDLHRAPAIEIDDRKARERLRLLRQADDMPWRRWQRSRADEGCEHGIGAHR
jgi:hypothetical protein